MRCRIPLASAAVAAALLLAAARTSSAAPCVPAHVGPNVAGLAEPWRRAVEALVTSTAAEGQPWSCTGGEVSLVVHEGGATLVVADAEGHTVAREVALPDEIEPLGEALLAKPAPFPASPGAPVAPASPPGTLPPKEMLGIAERGTGGIDPTAVPAPQPPAGAPALPDPRVLVSAMIAPRYAGGSNLVWGGVEARGAVPFGRWAGGLWFRYDGIDASLDGRTPMREACVGAAVTRAFGVGPLELRASLRPSVAIVTRSIDPDQHLVGDPTHTDFRIGAAAEGMIPFTSRLRAVVAFDAELAPQELGDGDHHDERLARFPAYTLGLGVGMELAIR